MVKSLPTGCNCLWCYMLYAKKDGTLHVSWWTLTILKSKWTLLNTEGKLRFREVK